MKFSFIIILFIFSFESSAEGLFGLGAGKVPTYRGSDNRDFIPIGVFQLDSQYHVFEVEGPEIFYNFKILKNIGFGILTSFEFGRDAINDESVTDPSETEQGFSMDIGPVAQIILPSLELSDEDSFNLRVSIQKNNKVDNDNNTYRLKLSYFLKLLFLLRTEIEMEYRYSESGYLNYFYGNSYQKSLKNGLREFMTNGSSSESLSISQNLILSFSENYGVFFR